MNETIKKLIKQSYDEVPHERDWDATVSVFNKEKFAALIIQEVLKETQQVWYDLNDLLSPPGESPRDIGMRIGQKGGVLKVMHHLKHQFGVQE
jgi:hypothetical protein